MLNAKKNEFVKQEIIREQKEYNNPNKNIYYAGLDPIFPTLTK